MGVCDMCSRTFSGFPGGLHACALVPLQIIPDTAAGGKWYFSVLLPPSHCLAKLSNLLIMLIFCPCPHPSPRTEPKLHQEGDFYLFYLLK